MSDWEQMKRDLRGHFASRSSSSWVRCFWCNHCYTSMRNRIAHSLRFCAFRRRWLWLYVFPPILILSMIMATLNMLYPR